MKLLGIGIGLIELLIFFVITFVLKRNLPTFSNMDTVSYYWICLTILTGIWEVCYIFNDAKVIKIAQNLLENKSHVWTNTYDLSYILPNKLSEIFYGEYGAYADREYMTLKDNWSRIIEGTHAIFCGLFSFLTLFYREEKVDNKFFILLGVAMGSQLMNSILYMGQYFIQIYDINNVNYDTVAFPTGFALLKRPFMYVNILWTVMPSYVIIRSLY